jgi:23S rRNA (cytidine1920-2'-O)/16S rRNA (cytidine1409-2'-O)-methyltransferase
VTVDASFISLKTLLPVIKKWFGIPPLSPSDAEGMKKEERTIIALIKPQFEAGRKEVSRGDGVVRDPEVHRQVLNDVLTYAKAEGLGLRGLVKSSLLGPKGNVEFLAWLDMNPNDAAVEELVSSLFPIDDGASHQTG